MQLYEQVTSIVPIIWTSNIYCSGTSKWIPHAKRVKIKINLPRSSVRSNYNKKHVFYNIRTDLSTKIKSCNFSVILLSQNYFTLKTWVNRKTYSHRDTFTVVRLPQAYLLAWKRTDQGHCSFWNYPNGSYHKETFLQMGNDSSDTQYETYKLATKRRQGTGTNYFIQTFV